MAAVAAGTRLVLAAFLALAAVGAAVGVLATAVGHFGRLAQGAGWGMCMTGAAVALVVGTSGSPARMALEGRWGYFGRVWGSKAPLPESPLWSLAAGLLAFAAGIAVVVLTY